MNLKLFLLYVLVLMVIPALGIYMSGVAMGAFNWAVGSQAHGLFTGDYQWGFRCGLVLGCLGSFLGLVCSLVHYHVKTRSTRRVAQEIAGAPIDIHALQASVLETT